jgi:HlyD family secretion protein
MPVSLTEQQLVSDEIQEIISYKPKWFVRNGNTIFIFVITLLLLLAFLIKYPDIVKGSVRIVALNAPRMLTAKQEGRLEKILVENGAQVQQGQTLAYLQSTAKHEQVLTLQKWIQEIETPIAEGNIEMILQKPMPFSGELGEIQTSYTEFLATTAETKQVLGSGYYAQKKAAIQKDIAYLLQLKQTTKKQQELQKKDYALQKTEHDAKQKLAEEKVIAPLEFNQDQSKLIGKEQSLEQMVSQLINSNISVHNKNKELLDLQKYVTDQRQKYQAALFTLKSRVGEWLQRYTVIASETGRIEFISFLQQNQLLSPGQELFFIQPAQSSYYAEMKAGQGGIGKVKNGQRVIIKLAGYPSDEFGSLDGDISYIANRPADKDSFLIRVNLPKGLLTNYKKEILFRNSLAATGEIITDDRKLIHRLIGKLNDLFKR